VAEVDDAVKFAQAAPYPDVSAGASGVYAPLDEEH
jgi:TPP-dependent pyruvate/acetoin dehydrogenase alpha subunit